MEGLLVMKTNYINKVCELLLENSKETVELNKAIDAVTNCLESDGLIYLFGCGHSHIFGEEFFYRAGGLANVYPILYEPLMLHEGAMQASVNEKKNDFISNFITDYEFTTKDVIFVTSTSGINPVPIDVAMYAKEQGATAITISSFIYKENEQSRHIQDLYLSEVGDINIDNNVLYGDALIASSKTDHSPVSTIVGISILHEIISNAINSAEVENIPVFISGNISGSKDHNSKLVKRFEERIPMLSKNLEITL